MSLAKEEFSYMRYLVMLLLKNVLVIQTAPYTFVFWY